MSSSPSNGPDTAAAAQQVRDMAKQFYGGFVPNQIKVLNEHSPAAARAYIATMDLIEQGELPDDEREAVILTVSRYNDCHYCTRTHAFLGREAGLSQETIESIHRGGLPDDDRLRSLVKATRLLLDKRGWLDDEDLSALESAGIGKTELYEINTLIGLKIFSNYVNHIAQTEVDDLVTDLWRESVTGVSLVGDGWKRGLHVSNNVVSLRTRGIEMTERARAGLPLLTRNLKTPPSDHLEEEDAIIAVLLAGSILTLPYFRSQ